MYGIYANIWGILMVNVTIYNIHGSYGYCSCCFRVHLSKMGLLKSYELFEAQGRETQLKFCHVEGGTQHVNGFETNE